VFFIHFDPIESKGEREREREGGKGAERGGRTRFFLVGGDHRAKRDKFRKKILLFLFLWGLKGA